MKSEYSWYKVYCICPDKTEHKDPLRVTARSEQEAISNVNSFLAQHMPDYRVSRAEKEED